MKKLIIILIFFSPSFAESQSNFRYLVGISSSFDLLRPTQYDAKLAYFSSAYTNGYSINIGLTNKFNYKKMFLRADFAFNRASQQQTFIFSNAVDLNISHTTTHTVPHFTLDWSLGRDFPLNNGNLFQFELGLSSAFTTGIGLYENRLRQSGSFISSYSDEDNHTSGLAYKEYNYEIEYQRPNLFGAFARIGWQIPVNHHFLTFGILAKAKRLYYQNFIVLSSDTYSAIANSRSQSSSFGVFVSYQFGKKIDN